MAGLAIKSVLGIPTTVEGMVGAFLGQLGPVGLLEAIGTGGIERATLLRVGGVGSLIVDLADENVALRLQLSNLTSRFITFRPMKRRSPADWRFRVVKWEDVTMPIRPGDRAEEQLIPALRVWVPLEDKPAGAPYWDVTGSRIIAQLRPLLPKVRDAGVFLHIVQNGEGPRSSYSVTVEAPSPT